HEDDYRSLDEAGRHDDRDGGDARRAGEAGGEGEAPCRREEACGGRESADAKTRRDQGIGTRADAEGSAQGTCRPGEPAKRQRDHAVTEAGRNRRRTSFLTSKP